MAVQQKKEGPPVTRLDHGLRGRPLLLGSLDRNVHEYIRKLGPAGGIVNRAIVIAAATGIVQHNNPAILLAHGGPVEFGKKWADSILLRMGLVKRKATKAARKVPPDFADVKLAFLQQVATIVQENEVPPDLIIKWDQTEAKFVPTSQWTLEQQGVKQVDVTGLDDKREMTVLLACTLSGSLLLPLLNCTGKTIKCHPVINFPAGWDVWHSDNHWSDSVLEALNKHHIKYTFVPASCTRELQPLDLTFNAAFKQ